MEFTVAETFLSLTVADMDRAVTFYSRSLGATTKWTSPRWSSLDVAGVRIGLFASPGHGGGRVGLHFAVTNLQAACASVAREGGTIVTPASEVAPGLHVADAADTEGNIFSLQAVVRDKVSIRAAESPLSRSCAT
jgi:predicted enzyme related to lactoylglutathione lyase